ncbi:MAG: archease [Methanobacteriota archaeon]|nr:MAG: archease [Euryarchaeota archaeon]
MMRYRLLEHTADAMIEAYGDTLSERFANAAYAMFDQITDANAITSVGEVTMSLSADSTEQLLVDFLQELLFLHDTENLVFAEFEVRVTGNTLEASVRGEQFDDSRHQKRAVVKGVTYHNLKIDDDMQKIVLLLDV